MVGVGNFLGVDVGGTKIAVGVVNADGEVLDRVVCPTVKDSPQAFVKAVIEAVARLRVDTSKIAGSGIALPAHVDREGGLVRWAPNIPVLNGFALASCLQDTLKVPVVLEYDGHALTLGEYWKGSGVGAKSMIFIALGTGIGGGMILDGKLYRGTSGTAGAFGWMIIDRSWLRDPDPVHGNLEFEASGEAFNRKLSFTNCIQADSASAGIAGVDLRDLGSIEVMSPCGAGNVKEEVMTCLGIAVASLVSVISPDVIVIGGGFGNFLGQPLIETLHNMVLRYSAPYTAKNVKICLSSLGVDAGIVGSARSAMLSL